MKYGQKRISISQIRRVATASFENAVRLHEDAILLFDEDRIPSALHTSALSIEETGKYFMHEHVLSSRMAMLFLARETKRLRGEKSADNAGADCRCGQLPGVEDLATLASHMGRADPTMCVLSVP
ncbi:MAG: AbiV family abortive infection protein [Phycisphaerae bacterium]|nr:AbiV family abortive infection protein [Phycisphaerae bacterium]